MNDGTQAIPVCYRHPDRETWIACQRCGRPICPDCMVSAAVGFQCPSCVQQGARETRSGQLPYGGAASANPALTSIALVVVNVAIWLAIRADSALVDTLALMPQGGIRVQGGVPEVVEGVSMGAWWQVITSGFTHVEVIHIGMNMVALYFLGPTLESVLGRVRMLAVYLVSLLCGSAAVMLFANPHQQTLGASGAIFGLLGALIVVAYKVHGDVRTIGMWLVLNLVITFTVPNISWQGHLGGLIGGALLTVAIVYAPRGRRAVVQWSAVAALSVIALALIVLRAADLGSVLIPG